MTNTKALYDKIDERGFKVKYIASRLGLTYQGFQNKAMNKTEFVASEISELCDILNITTFKEQERIFFAKKRD